MDAKEGRLVARMFAEGACSAARAHGFSDEDSASIASCAVKEAASGGRGWDDEEDTLWSRNKSWIIPALVGSLAFYAGADGERNGRRDRGYLSNAGRNIVKKLGKLFGVIDDPLTDAATKTPGMS